MNNQVSWEVGPTPLHVGTAELHIAAGTTALLVYLYAPYNLV